MSTPPALAARGARVWDGLGWLGEADVVIADGRVEGISARGTAATETTAATTTTAQTEIDGRGLWLVPGIVDAHAHVTWNDFDAAERETRSADEREAATSATLQAMLAAGVTRARDAGGAGESVRSLRNRDGGPRLQLSVDLLDRARVDELGGVGPAVQSVLDAGAEWVKLVATGGVASAAGSQLVSHFSPAEFTLAVRLASEVGARVMVHAWGGEAVTHALEAGAASIEHGIFLTAEQAALGADTGAVLVPTLRIYRLVAEMIRAELLPAAFRGRVAEAVAAHPLSVRRARDAGMPIAVGTDYSTPDQHGTNLLELAELRRAGLSAEEVLTAATVTGARLLASAERSDTARRADADASLDLAGRIAPGARADALLLRVDPRDPAAFDRPDAVALVIQDGRVVAQHPPSP